MHKRVASKEDMLENKGFTLVEILVALTILATLGAGVLIGINPFRQTTKAKDVVRQESIREIKKALNLYYSDKKCFPSKNSSFSDVLTNGGEWKENNTVYMKKVPQDPNNVPFSYYTDTKACPQWGIVFAKLDKQPSNGDACVLSSLSKCAPSGYNSSWACQLSGDVDCQSLQASALKYGDKVTPTTVPSISSTPIPTPATGGNFTVAMNTDPYFTAGNISPYPAARGLQRFSIEARSTNPINSVNVTVRTDTQVNTYPLHLVDGENTNGTWYGIWNITDTINKQYFLRIQATDSMGITVTTEIPYK